MDEWADLMVIGGGISGLTLARACADVGMRVVVLEASPRLGGALHTAAFTFGASEFWTELGAHTLFNSYTSLLATVAPLEVHEEIQQRRRLPFRLWREGATRSLVGALHWLDLARSLPRALRLGREGQRVGDYFAAIAGPRNYAQVFGPALDGLLCQPAAEFPAELIFKRRPRDAHWPRSFTLQGGLGTLPPRLARGIEVHCATPVQEIRRDGIHFLVRADARDLGARRLAIATPVHEAARLLRPWAPAVAELLGTVGVATVESTTVVLPTGSVALPPVAGLIARDAPFYSMVSRDVVPDPRWRGFTFHCRPGLPEEARVALAARVLRVDPAAFVGIAHTRHRLPALRLGHSARMEGVDALLRGTSMALAGNYFGGVSIEDCVARATKEAARLRAAV